MFKFEDENIIVCVKPAGVLSQFSEKDENMISIITTAIFMTFLKRFSKRSSPSL